MKAQGLSLEPVGSHQTNPFVSKYNRLLRDDASSRQLQREYKNIMVLHGDVEITPLPPVKIMCSWCGGLLMSNVLDCHRCGGPRRMQEEEKLPRGILDLTVKTTIHPGFNAKEFEKRVRETMEKTLREIGR